MSTKPDVGPGALADPGTAGGPALALAFPELVSVQAYVLTAKGLPTTDDDFRKALGAGAPSDLSDYRDLLTCYGTIKSHCDAWDDTLDTIVGLADSIYEYGIDTVPAFYGGIGKYADALQKDPNDARAQQALAAIVKALEDKATDYVSKAGAAAALVKQFADNAAFDGVALEGPDGKGGLLQAYDKKCGSQSAKVAQIKQELAADKDALQAANDEYAHDVTVAATTPTYVWVVPLGTVAAAVVAGVYGKKATDALDRAHASEANIEQLGDEEAAAANTIVMLQLASSGAGGIDRALQAALPAVGKIQGAWEGILADLGSIKKIIEDDIEKALPIIMSLGVDEAITAWKNVANAADQYRQNAYVKVLPGGAASAAKTPGT